MLFKAVMIVDLEYGSAETKRVLPAGSVVEVYGIIGGHDNLTASVFVIWHNDFNRFRMEKISMFKPLQSD